MKTIKEVRKDLMDKSHMHVHETITNMAIMVFLKEKVCESEINKSVQTTYLS
jgi:hypothetical protein